MDVRPDNQRVCVKRWVDLLVAVPCATGTLYRQTAEWLFKLGATAQSQEDLPIKSIRLFWPNTWRIMLNRNAAAKAAVENAADFLLMLDPDMVPDVAFTEEHAWINKHMHEDAMPFLPSSLSFALQNPGAIIGAPAVREGDRQINVFFKSNQENQIRPLTSEEVNGRLSSPVIEEVEAIGTGLILIDCLVFKRIPPPWFCDLYSSDVMDHLSMSQDVWFCNKAREYGFKIYCNWKAPAGHIKTHVMLPLQYK